MGPDQKKADDSPQARTLTERERKRELKTTHHPHWLCSSLFWRKWLNRKSPNTPLLFALVTSDWPRAYKSNNPITIKHWTFFHFLIPYQHDFRNPAILTFYSFVSKRILKIFMCLCILCFCNCVYFFPCNQLYTDIRTGVRSVQQGKINYSSLTRTELTTDQKTKNSTSQHKMQLNTSGRDNNCRSRNRYTKHACRFDSGHYIITISHAHRYATWTYKTTTVVTGRHEGYKELQSG